MHPWATARSVRICLGGTFHPFHAGHKALLDAASDAEHLFIGITRGDLAHRDRPIPHWGERAEAIQAYLSSQGFRGEVACRPLEDGVGPAVAGDYDAIVVSPETLHGATQINEKRQAAGRSPLLVRVVPHTLSEDHLVLSSTRIHAGDVDADGIRITPLRIAVGSANPVKVAAVEAEIGALLDCPLDVRGFPVDSGVPEQPKEAQTLTGARQRAQAAMAAWPDAEYGIGVEAGLNQDPEGSAWYDVQACVVLDADGLETDGWGPAFQYPDWVAKRALAGEMISDILGPVAGDDRIGSTTGAIGYLTDGHLDRTGLTRSAVLMAFVPRLRRSLYLDPLD